MLGSRFCACRLFSFVSLSPWAWRDLSVAGAAWAGQFCFKLFCKDELGSVVKDDCDALVFEGPPRAISHSPTGNLTVAPSSGLFVMSSPCLLNKSSIPPLLSDDLPPGLSDEHLGLPVPATMSNINPFTFVSATDAVAKDRAGRRDRPVLRHAGPSQVDDRQDPSVPSQLFFVTSSYSACIAFVKIEPRIILHFMQPICLTLNTDMRPFCWALARTRSMSRLTLVSLSSSLRVCSFTDNEF